MDQVTPWGEKHFFNLLKGIIRRYIILSIVLFIKDFDRNISHYHIHYTNKYYRIVYGWNKKL